MVPRTDYFRESPKINHLRSVLRSTEFTCDYHNNVILNWSKTILSDLKDIFPCLLRVIS